MEGDGYIPGPHLKHVAMTNETRRKAGERRSRIVTMQTVAAMRPERTGDQEEVGYASCRLKTDRCVGRVCMKIID